MKECARAGRVLTEAELNPTPTITPIAMPTANPTITFPELEIKYPGSEVGQTRQTPEVSQDNYKSVSPPSANTRHQRRGRTIAEDYLFHMMDVPTSTQPFTTQQATSCKFPLLFLCNIASSVLDKETRELLEYCHLLKHPIYKDVCSKVFGEEIRHHTTTTETIAFMSKCNIPQARRRDITYGRIVCNYCPKKKDPHRTHITMGEN